MIRYIHTAKPQSDHKMIAGPRSIQTFSLCLRKKDLDYRIESISHIIQNFRLIDLDQSAQMLCIIISPDRFKLPPFLFPRSCRKIRYSTRDYPHHSEANTHKYEHNETIQVYAGESYWMPAPSIVIPFHVRIPALTIYCHNYHDHSDHCHNENFHQKYLHIKLVLILGRRGLRQYKLVRRQKLLIQLTRFSDLICCFRSFRILHIFHIPHVSQIYYPINTQYILVRKYISLSSTTIYPINICYIYYTSVTPYSEIKFIYCCSHDKKVPHTCLMQIQGTFVSYTIYAFLTLV